MQPVSTPQVDRSFKGWYTTDVYYLSLSFIRFNDPLEPEILEISELICI